ncbi:MAG TPA: CvpA family protein [Candidatus Limnocylindria bacterium]|nr:CvpA family protein [Candidatus Limnocylindria bacterium]
MPVADLAILALIGQQAWTGRRVGFVMGVFQLVVTVASIVAALVFEEPVGLALDDVMPLDAGTRRLVVFAIISTAASYGFGFIGGRILGPLMARQARSRATVALDRALGLVPAAVRGVVYAGSMVYMARIALPEDHDVRVQLATSVLAPIAEAVFTAVTPFARAL